MKSININIFLVILDQYFLSDIGSMRDNLCWADLEPMEQFSISKDSLV